jgi:hypothetical protein
LHSWKREVFNGRPQQCETPEAQNLGKQARSLAPGSEKLTPEGCAPDPKNCQRKSPPKSMERRQLKPSEWSALNGFNHLASHPRRYVACTTGPGCCAVIYERKTGLFSCVTWYIRAIQI